MAMKRCPNCGEKYSDTYESCPFCEEEEALNHGEEIRRSAGRSGKRAAKNSQPNFLSPILIALIILMICLLIYLLFGDKIKEKFSNDDPGNKVEEVIPPTDTEPSDTEGEVPPAEGVMPGDEGAEDPEGTEPTQPATADYESLPATLTLNNPDFTLKVGDTYTVSVKSGSGDYTWVSSDDGVVSVDHTGKVTAISPGKVTLTAYNSTAKATGVIYVKAGAGGVTSTGTTTPAVKPSGGENKLNTTDFTFAVGEPDVKLTVSGITTAFTWTSENPAVATVSGSGVVKAVGKGTTNVTASWDGQSLTCIVRVSR